MLSRIKIENFALIEKLEIEFKEGLNVITGSTGAGKSIIIGALEFALGGKATEEMIRSGESYILVETDFEFHDGRLFDELARELAIRTDENKVTIRREYRKKGSNRILINGKQISLNALKAVSEKLASILGQHSHQTLLNPLSHIGYLDAFCVPETKQAELKKLYNKAVDLKDRIAYARKYAGEIADRIDLIAFQIQEIDLANLKPGEEENLKNEKSVLENAERIREICEMACSAIIEADDSAIGKIGEVEKALKGLPGENTDLAKISGLIGSATDSLSDAMSILRNMADRLEHDPSRLEQINERLDLIFRLKKKYGGTIETALAHGANSKNELAALKTKVGDSGSLEKEFAETRAALNKMAAEISTLRHSGKNALEKLVTDKLSGIGMPKARFAVEISVAENADGFYESGGKILGGDASGSEYVEFQFCANPGEGLKPLAKIASGGEISRVMLALENAFIRKDTDNCEVFDEIDVGISGEVAAKIALQLKELSKKHQIICITHLHQIASAATHHYRVFKEKSGKRSITVIRRLDYEGRVNEIASLLSGEKITPRSLAGARELLELMSKNE